MEAEVARIFLSNYKSNISFYDIDTELKTYNSGLRWVFLDYSSIWRATLSWSIFVLLNIVVPILSHFVFSCQDCDLDHQKPYDGIVQLSLSLFATISFVSISSFARKYGLRRFLFLDKLSDESEKVQDGYTDQIHIYFCVVVVFCCVVILSILAWIYSTKASCMNAEESLRTNTRSTNLLLVFVLPCFVADSAYKIWWFSTVGNGIPYVYNIYVTKILVCILLMCSWLYRISICFLVCLLFRLMCSLQILRLEDFALVFERESCVGPIMIEHLRIRRNLRVISHRFRPFILSTLILVTISQLVVLLVATSPSSTLSISTDGELALCSITLVTGLFICLRSATKITHKALSVTSLAAKWHVCATVDSFDGLEQETSSVHIASARARHPITTSDWTDDEEVDGEDGALDNTDMVPILANTLSYQKRQALVTYFDYNKAGISIYGVVLDRAELYTVLGIQLSLLLWILDMTVGIS